MQRIQGSEKSTDMSGGREEYRGRKMKREYKDLCENKKKKEREEFIREVGRARSQGEICDKEAERGEKESKRGNKRERVEKILYGFDGKIRK